MVAGPEALPRDSKDKEVMAAAAPSGCDWSGFYVGLHAGGQFGHSEDLDFNYQFLGEPHPFGYSESGFVGGMQVGYNWQWRWLVFGPEADLGYMNLDGTGIEPGAPGGDTRGKSSSDFYMTFRGRLGVALNCWLIYATGGGIGVNYQTRVIDNCNTGNCGPDLIDAHTKEFDWGYTIGGGIERAIGRHWSVKVEYLYFALEDQSFSAQNFFRNGPYGFTAETTGHIVRAGLSFRF